MLNKIKSALSLPSVWRTDEEVKQGYSNVTLKAESKISEWVDAVNALPKKIIITQNRGDMIPTYTKKTLYWKQKTTIEQMSAGEVSKIVKGTK